MVLSIPKLFPTILLYLVRENEIVQEQSGENGLGAARVTGDGGGGMWMNVVVVEEEE